MKFQKKKKRFQKNRYEMFAPSSSSSSSSLLDENDPKRQNGTTNSGNAAWTQALTDSRKLALEGHYESALMYFDSAMQQLNQYASRCCWLLTYCLFP